MASFPVRLVAACALCLSVFAAPASGAATPKSWAQPQIKLVIKHGIFTGTPATFAPQDPLTAGTLAHVIAKLTGLPEMSVADPTAQVSIQDLDTALVHALGLGDAANRFLDGAQAAGLNPPSRFGTEAVARLLGLRLDHPAAHEDLELQLQQAATRAEAAYSIGKILGFDPGWDSDSDSGSTTAVSGTTTTAGTRLDAPAAQTDFASTWQVQYVESASQSFALPTLTDWQRRILTTAVSYIGYPYVWGGEDNLGTPGDGTGGFDCSGFVWGVYKLTAYPNEGNLAGVLQGRTTMAMSGEVPRANRIHYAKLQPGDVLFFGGKGPRSKPAAVDHAAIYLGGGWYINSSGTGVAIGQLGDDWRRKSFAWARRPLQEAGLE